MSNNKVIKNASWIIGCKIAQSAINLVISMISARYLGPSNYGLIMYAASVVAFVVPIMQLGLSKTLVQELIERPDKEGTVLGTAMTLNVVASLACMLGVFSFFKIANADEQLTITVGCLYSISLVVQATEIIQYWFQAKLLSKYTSLTSLAAYVAVASYKIFLLVTGKNVTWFAISNSLDFLIISAILIILYYRLGNQKLSFSIALGKEMLHKSKHFIVSAMMVTIFAETDRIMLKNMISEAETGLYSAAVSCAGMTSFVFSAIIDSMRPQILDDKKKNSPQYENHMVQLYCIITYLALAQCVFMTVFAKPIILVLYGSKYSASILPLSIVVWYTTFSYYGAVRNVWILAEQKQRYLWIINLSGALGNVILNAFLIPPYGSVGAAVASLVTQIFTNVIIGFILRPIRFNNVLMLKGLNPLLLTSLVSQLMVLMKKRKK